MIESFGVSAREARRRCSYQTINETFTFGFAFSVEPSEAVKVHEFAVTTVDFRRATAIPAHVDDRNTNCLAGKLREGRPQVEAAEAFVARRTDSANSSRLIDDENAPHEALRVRE